MTTTAKNMTILHTTDVRQITDHEEQLKVRATYGMRDLGQGPYFTVTIKGWNKYASTNTDPIRGGADHELAARAFPKLKELIALHLSNALTGEPMHAEANGWYFFKRDGADHAAKYLRTTPDTFEGVTTREEFAAVVDQLRPQWQQEADDARAQYGLI